MNATFEWYMRRFLCTLSVFLFIAAGFGQSAYNPEVVAGIRNEMRTANDSVMGTLYNKMYLEFYSHSAFDSAQKVAGEAVIHARRAGNKKQESNAMTWQGIIEFEKGNYEDALSLYLGALKIKEAINDQKGQAAVLLNIAGIYYERNHPEKAVEIYLKALELKVKLNDKAGQGNIYINLGNVEGLLAEKEEKLNHEKEFQQFLKQADQYYKKSKLIYQDLKDSTNLAIVNRSLANIYLQQGKLQEAEQLAYSAYKYLRLKNDRHYAQALIVLGRVHYEKGSYYKSVDYLLEAYQTATRNSMPFLVKEASEDLAKTYEKLKQHDKSLYFQRTYSRINDSLQGAKLSEQLALLQVKYESEKKEKEIEHLDKENSKKELVITQKRDQIVIISGISVLALSLFGVFYFYNNAKKQHEINRVKQARQKEIIETIITTEEKARKKIAADLHDGLGQILTAAKMNLSNLNESFPQEQDRLKQVTELVSAAQYESKNMALNLMPLTLKENGLVESIRHICAKFNKPDVQEISFNAYNVPDKLEAVVEINTYRICQELLNNAVKYSKASKIFLQLFCRDKKLIVQIEDNGVGFDKEKTKKDSLGMNTLKDRVALLHGEIEIDTAPNKGTNIFIELSL